MYALSLCALLWLMSELMHMRWLLYTGMALFLIVLVVLVACINFNRNIKR